MGAFVLGVFILVPIIALIPATIASDKGHSFAGYYFFAVVLFVPALIVALLIDPADQQPARDMRLCPLCLSRIPSRATVCAYCRRDIPSGPERQAPRGQTAADVEVLAGMSTAGRRCPNPVCDASGLRTNATVCPVCTARTERIPGDALRPPG